MSRVLISICIIFGVAFILFILDRIALWMEARGWLYYRKTKHRPGGTIGNALLEIHTMFEPAKRNILEERKQEKEEKSEAGDPPEAGDQ